LGDGVHRRKDFVVIGGPFKNRGPPGGTRRRERTNDSRPRRRQEPRGQRAGKRPRDISKRFVAGKNFATPTAPFRRTGSAASETKRRSGWSSPPRDAAYARGRRERPAPAPWQSPGQRKGNKHDRRA
jgi:hypothetical protein